MLKGFAFKAAFIKNILFLLVAALPNIYCRCPRAFGRLKVEMLHIPTPAVTGDNVILRCGYGLGNQTLYAVKWYKNMGEFFRYVPASKHPFKTFHQLGIDVDMSKSDHNTVFLRNVSTESNGNITCQISTDKPIFRCVQETRQLEIVVPPSDGPTLMTEKNEYELGDNVSILCNSGKSKPAPELKWYINDQLAQAEPSDQRRVVHPDQFESSSLALRFPLKPDVLHDGKVTLKCVASINHIYAETVKEIRARGSKQMQLHTGLFYLVIAISFILHGSKPRYPI